VNDARPRVGVDEVEARPPPAVCARSCRPLGLASPGPLLRLEHLHDLLDYPADALAREARCADLVQPGDSFGSLDPGVALLKLVRPTLVVPDGVSSLRAEDVVIGWKDTLAKSRFYFASAPDTFRLTARARALAADAAFSTGAGQWFLFGRQRKSR
jgi:hypothetical protein